MYQCHYINRTLHQANNEQGLLHEAGALVHINTVILAANINKKFKVHKFVDHSLRTYRKRY